ncbi:MAG TPA: ATP-binding cassette domain-containing protein [Kiritimatiellia bacterium]|nr:ATP-binding cassette domain-containing protein [Kiritimatiellia bacterium]
MSGAPLLDIHDVHVWFPIRRGVFSRVRGHVRAVQGVSLQVGAGEVVGLVGESGCGKSTLARAVMMLQPPAQGVIRLEGRDVYAQSATGIRELRRQVQIVFQDPYASLNPRLPVYQIITEGLIAYGMLRENEQEERARALLHDVGLGADALYRYPHEFSGGQRQRISIARALSMRPKLIVCDEAVSALDVSIQAQVINLLMELKAKYGLSYLFISHDLSVVKFMADRVAVMYLGRIVEEGRCRDVMANPRHPYTQALLAAAPVAGGPRGVAPPLSGELPSVTHPPSGCPFHTRCPKAMPVCRERYPDTIDQHGHQTACHLFAPADRATTGVAIP